MIDLKKHFIGRYKLGKCDCWTLIQDIYRDEHGIELPDYPFAISGNESEFANFLRANLVVIPVNKPEKGVFAHYSYMSEHVGYCLNDKQYIHRLKTGTKVENIPNKHIDFYKIKGVLGE